MPAIAQVLIHRTQFPQNVRRDLLTSLRTRRVNHKFHYDTLKQTQKWLALHRAYAPSRTDPDCSAAYQHCFEAAVATTGARRVHLVGLGCGGGQKDARLLKLLRDSGKEVTYTPADVSLAMVLTAREAALKVIPEAACFPLVCDLATAADLARVLEERTHARSAARLITFFGMIPNFEPGLILGGLAKLVRPADSLLFSANLAPGPDYAAGMRRVLPLYDNALTRDWLLTFLLDLGVERSDGQIRFVIEAGPPRSGLHRIAAYFDFERARSLQLDEHRFSFRAGQSIRLFFSYRHTPALVCSLLEPHRLEVRQRWVTRSEEEGVFLGSRR